MQIISQRLQRKQCIDADKVCMQAELVCNHAEAHGINADPSGNNALKSRMLAALQERYAVLAVGVPARAVCVAEKRASTAEIADCAAVTTH